MSGKLYEVIGLSEDVSAYSRNAEIIADSIEYCRKNGLSGLKLPSGSFAVYNSKALELREALLNGEIGATDDVRWHKERNVVFDIDSFAEFEIIGDNTRLLLDGLSGVFSFHNVGNVKLWNVTVDWLNPLYFTAEVIKTEGKRITVRPDTALRGGEPIVSFQNIDRKTGKQKEMSVFSDISSVECKEDGLVSFTSEDTVGLFEGDGIIARYIYNYSPIIHFYLCKNVSVRSVTLHSGCGMGVIAHKCGNLDFDRYRDVPSVGRPMSTNTDSTHFISCNGRISMRDCEFEGMGDDAVNVHGFYITVTEILDDKTVAATIEAAVQDGITDIPDAGDRVEFSARDTLLPFAEGEIARVDANEKNLSMIIGFKDKLPETVRVGSVMGNTSKTAELLVENCTVKNIRGRAMLIQTRNAVIKNNLFEGCTGQGVHISTATGWWESIGTRNVEISSNRFIDCGYGITKYCDAVGVVVEVEAERQVAGVHKNISIKNNYIEGKNVGIKASGADGITVSGNTFVGCRAECEITDCENIAINPNPFDTGGTL